ncbi:MAG: hypothetical protein JW846_10885 [Dehalococcoidia bacterium]|nr:hypothetical protein [Dehalococcoidia bacterium]
MRRRTQWSGAGQSIGYWAAVLATIWSLCYIVAYPPWVGMLPVWSGIEQYAADFDVARYLGWVIPSFLLAITFPVLMVAVYLYVPVDRRAPGLVALLCAVLCGAILGTDYWLLATVVKDALLSGAMDGLEWLVIGSPYSITNAVEGLGYLFMGLSMLFAGFAWRIPGRRRKLTKLLLVVNGCVVIGGVILGALGWSLGSQICLGLWMATLPVATGLLALRFREDMRAGRMDCIVSPPAAGGRYDR